MEEEQGEEEASKLEGRGWFRGRSKVRLIPTLKVERGRAGFIARALVLLFAQPGVDL